MPVTLPASSCPGVLAPSAMLSVASGVPLLAEAVGSGETATIIGKWNRNAVRSDLAGRYGGGLRAVTWGLALTYGTDLNLAIAAGHALCDGVVEVASGIVLPIAPSLSRAWVWLTPAGAATYTTTVTPPSSVACLLGSVVTGSTAITSVDTSGVVYLRGGIGYRETADPAAPSDTPPSTVALVTATSGGCYLWTGAVWRRLAGAVGSGDQYLSITGSVPDADVTLTAAQYGAQWIGLAWTGWTAAHNVIVPTVAGATWLVTNSAGYAATVKTASGAGVAVATGKTARVGCNGTDVIRLSADA